MNLKPNQNQARIMWFALTALAITTIVAVAVGFVWGIGQVLDLLSPVLWPLAIAAVVAYLFDPVVDWLEEKNISRTWGIIIIFTATASLMAGILASVIPQMANEIGGLVSKVSKLPAQAQDGIETLAKHLKSSSTSTSTNAPATNAPPGIVNSLTNYTTNSVEFAIADLQTNQPVSGINSSTNGVSAAAANQIQNKIISSGTDWLENVLPKIGNWLLAQLAKARSLIDLVITLILIPIYTFYFLREKRGIKAHWSEYLPIRDSYTKDETVFILTAINQYMIAFFRGQVLVSLCSGFLYTIGFLIIGLDYAFLLGFFAVLLTMIPFLGAFINCILAVSLTALQFGDWFHPLMVLCLFAVVQTLESFFYSPKIMGDRVGLHPVVIIVALMVGATLFGGILGGVLAIPLAAALRVIMFRYIWKKRSNKK